MVKLLLTRSFLHLVKRTVRTCLFVRQSVSLKLFIVIKPRTLKKNGYFSYISSSKDRQFAPTIFTKLCYFLKKFQPMLVCQKNKNTLNFIKKTSMTITGCARFKLAAYFLQRSVLPKTWKTRFVKGRASFFLKLASSWKCEKFILLQD